MNSLFPFLNTQSTNKIAKTFITEVRCVIGLAEEEIRLGEVVNKLISKDESISLLTIAIWHYDQGLKQIKIAFGLLKQAKKFHLSEKYKSYVELREKECREKANHALLQKTDLEVLLEKRKLGEILQDELPA